MNITITFRNMDSSEAVKAYAREKVAKLQKFLRQPMTAKVTCAVERNRHLVEARVSSGGSHLEAHEDTEDMYASIDKVIDKLERQIRTQKGAAKAGQRESVREGKLPDVPGRTVARISDGEPLGKAR